MMKQQIKKVESEIDNINREIAETKAKISGLVSDSPELSVLRHKLSNLLRDKLQIQESLTEVF